MCERGSYAYDTGCWLYDITWRGYISIPLWRRLFYWEHSNAEISASLRETIVSWKQCLCEGLWSHYHLFLYFLYWQWGLVWKRLFSVTTTEREIPSCVVHHFWALWCISFLSLILWEKRSRENRHSGKKEGILSSREERGCPCRLKMPVTDSREIYDYTRGRERILEREENISLNPYTIVISSKQRSRKRRHCISCRSLSRKPAALCMQWQPLTKILVGCCLPWKWQWPVMEARLTETEACWWRGISSVMRLWSLLFS